MTAYDVLINEIHIHLNEKPLASPPLLFGLDGPAAAGKSTLAIKIQASLDIGLIPMDYFFLQEKQRIPERLAEIGGFIDYERFEEEILHPLSTGHEAILRKYNCQSKCIEKGHLLDPTIPGYLIEGVYALHPRFRPYYHRAYFLDIDSDTQHTRLKKRENAAQYRRFIDEFLPRENAYFTHFSIAEKANLRLK